jgi:hypothetical protein
MSESRARALRRAIRNGATMPAGETLALSSRRFRRAVALANAPRLPRSPEARAALGPVVAETAATVHTARRCNDGFDDRRIDRSIERHERVCGRRLREAYNGGWHRSHHDDPIAAE